MHDMHFVHKPLSREDLELVLAIAEEGTVTRAAARLHLSQSAVSHHLRALEDLLGASLFIRGSRRMAPSPLGEEMAQRARRICSEFRGSEEALRRMISGSRQIIRLGTECFTSYRWLPALVRKMARTAKNIDLRIVVEATRKSRTALATGEIDAVIVQSPGNSAGLIYWPLFRDELVLLTGKEHPLAKRKFVRPEEISAETLIFHEMNGRKQPLIDEFFLSVKNYPAQVREVQLTEAIIEMVRANMGTSVLARWLVESELRQGDLFGVRLGKNGLWRDWRLAAVQDHPLLSQIEQLARTFSSLLAPRAKARSR